MRFTVTEPTGMTSIYVEESPIPYSEQAASVTDHIKKSLAETADAETTDANIDNGSEVEFETTDVQLSLRKKFLENYKLLDDPEKGREAESYITYCLYRLEPHKSIQTEILSLLPKLPWRSEAITTCLGRFKNNEIVIKRLQNFIVEHDLYSWHQANALWALYQAGNAKNLMSICRVWLADSKLDWYARTIAARVLTEVSGQHAYFVECLRREQDEMRYDPEEAAILRQELAYGAFRQTKSKQKQMTLFRMICIDKSPLLHRLVIYLLQQPSCEVSWNDLKPYHQEMGKLSELVKRLNLSTDAPRQCFITQTLTSMYDVSLSAKDLRYCYVAHYDRAVEKLRESINHYHTSPDDYIRTFHQFAHITLIAFYEHVFPSEGGVYEGYAQLINRKLFTQHMPSGHEVWLKLGSMRNRVDHPVDSKTKAHSKKIGVNEVEMLKKEIKVALQEIFDFWLTFPSAVVPTSTATTS